MMVSHADASVERTMRTLIAAFAVAIAAAGTSLAQDRGEFYRAGYLMAGTYLRAAAVCTNKSYVEKSFTFISSKEFRAFSAAYPQTYEKWMREGAESFNRMVMKDGIPAACNAIARARR